MTGFSNAALIPDSDQSWLALPFPHLALDLASRGSEAHRELPLAISDKVSGQQVIIDCNPAAERLGIRPGLPVNAALGLAEGLYIAERDIEAETNALQRLAAWCYQYSSMVTIIHQRHTLLLEVGASRRLFGEPAPLAQQLASELLLLGYHVQTGIGPTPEGAQLAAHRGLVIEDMEQLQQQLHQLPLQSLLLDHSQHKALDKMGFQRVADLLRLPRKSLARRLGPSLVDYLDRLTGIRPDPQTAWHAPESFSSGFDLTAEIHTSQRLLFPLRKLVSELCGALRASDCGVQEIYIRLTLRQGHEDLRLGLQQPGREEAHLMLLIRERLERLRLHQPARHIHLRAGDFLPFDSEQNALFRNSDDRKAQPVDALLERLQARLGKEAVTGIRGVQDHRPEYSWSQRRLDEPADCEPMPHRPLWLYPSPKPCRIQDYEVLAGPERIESGWWDGHDCRRDYFVVRDAEGATLWAYREYKPDIGWFLHGIFG